VTSTPFNRGAGYFACHGAVAAGVDDKLLVVAVDVSSILYFFGCRSGRLWQDCFFFLFFKSFYYRFDSQVAMDVDC